MRRMRPLFGGHISAGIMSPLSRGSTIGEKVVTLMACMNVYINEHSVSTRAFMSA